MVEELIGIGQGLVVVLQLGVVEEGQTVEGCVTGILAESELHHVETLLVLLLEEGCHGIVAQVALFHLALVGLVVGSQSLVELVGHVVDASCKGIDGNVGALCAQVVQLGNGRSGAELTIDVGILVVALWILGVCIDSHVIVLCGCTTVVSQGLEVTQYDERRSILAVLNGLEGILSIDAGIGSVLSLVEGTGKSSEVLGALLVGLVESLHLLVQIGGFATNDVLNGINVGLGAVLCHSGCTVTCGQRCDE